MSTTNETALAQIPQNIPSYAVVPIDKVREMNAAAVQGISTGFPPSIRIKGSKFRIVDGNGEENVLKASDLAENEFLPIVILAARPGLHKQFYAAAYDPNQTEAFAPDCFSTDGITPDASVAKPVCGTCAGCPNNAFGSGRNQAGQPTKGKACADSKILAVAYKGLVYMFKIPPASLKNFGVYVKNLTTRGIPLGNVLTYVGFDDNADYSMFQFRVGGWVPEAALERIMALAQSQEVQDIIKPVGYTSAPVAPAKLEQAAAKAAEEAPPAKTEAEPAPARRGRPKKDETASAAPAPAAQADPAVEKTALMSDDDIKAALGL
jgi:hypothetical protein